MEGLTSKTPIVSTDFYGISVELFPLSFHGISVEIPFPLPRNVRGVMERILLYF